MSGSKEIKAVRTTKSSQTLASPSQRRRSKLFQNPPLTRSSEPILFPKLRIYFAEFLHLHSLMILEAVHLEHLMRIRVRRRGFEKPMAHAVFKERSKSTGHFQIHRKCFSEAGTVVLCMMHFPTLREDSLTRKEDSSRILVRCVAFSLRRREYSHRSSFRNVNRIPFRGTVGFPRRKTNDMKRRLPSA